MLGPPAIPATPPSSHRRRPPPHRAQVWRYEGANTLAFYLRRRDGLRALARDLDVPEALVIPVAMRQLLSGLAALHAAGLVHRDVKPLSEPRARARLRAPYRRGLLHNPPPLPGATPLLLRGPHAFGATKPRGPPGHARNPRLPVATRQGPAGCLTMHLAHVNSPAATPLLPPPPHPRLPLPLALLPDVIVSERDRRLKLIDLGAAADLRGGTNFAPEESILDPLYCPPEQVGAGARAGWGQAAPVGVGRLRHLLRAPPPLCGACAPCVEGQGLGAGPQPPPQLTRPPRRRLLTPPVARSTCCPLTAPTWPSRCWRRQ